MEPMANPIVRHINLILLLTSFPSSTLVVMAYCLLSCTQVTWTTTRNCHLVDISVAPLTPPSLFSHKLTVYSSINKSAVFILCLAVKQLNRQINDRVKAIYTFCPQGISACAFLSMSSYSTCVYVKAHASKCIDRFCCTQ